MRGMSGVAMAAVGLLAVAGWAQAPPPAQVETIGTPVRSARTWAWPVTPNPRGGYNFITQVWNYGSPTTPEWIVVALETGKYSTNDTIPGYNNAAFAMELGVRAPKGRIFFALAHNAVCYYEPTDETIQPLGTLLPMVSGGPTRFHIMRLGPDGQVYGSTQSSDGYCYVAVINPDTLEYRTFAKIGGKKRAVGLTYGYRLAMDPPWVYVAVGQGQWSLVALNTDTGESKILAEIESGLISFDLKDGVRAKVQNGTAPELAYYWCVDGELRPATATYDPTKLDFLPRRHKLIEFQQTKLWPLTGTAPEVDTAGLGTLVDNRFQVRWRPGGATAEQPWRTVSFPVKNVEPIGIESLTGLPDGTVLGSADQYNGFFRYAPAAKTLEWYGKHGPSGVVVTPYEGQVYLTGYPNGQTFVYDPARPWQAAPQGGIGATGPRYNPTMLGYFSDSGAKYAYFLLPGPNGRLYFGGRRERSGQGACVGYYEPATKRFAGSHEQLNFMQPRGMVVLPGLQRVVLSGDLIDDPEQPVGKPSEAQLVVYDLELKELARITVKAGLPGTGALHPVDGKRFVGLIRGRDVNALYLYDLEQRAVVKWVDLPSRMDRFTRHPQQGWYVGWLAGQLVKVDPATLELTPLASLEQAPTCLTWAGGALYGSYGGELVRITWPGQ